jgi:hypothetical protein
MANTTTWLRSMSTTLARVSKAMGARINQIKTENRHGHAANYRIVELV